MFIATAIVAFACAVLTPLARTEDGLPTIGIGAAVFVAVLVWSSNRRLKIEKQAGSVIQQFQLRTPPNQFPDLVSRKSLEAKIAKPWRSWIMGLIRGLFACGLLIVVYVGNPRDPNSWPRAAVFLGLFAAFVTRRVWWRTDQQRLEVREHGLVFLLELRPWTDIKRIELIARPVNNVMFQFKESRWYCTLESEEAVKLREIVEQQFGNRLPPRGLDSGGSVLERAQEKAQETYSLGLKVETGETRENSEL